MIVSHGKFVIRPEQLERAKKLMSEMVDNTLKEPGCISYDYFISMSRPNVVMLFQEWESVEAVNLHFTTAHMAKFLSEIPELLESEIITHRYAVSRELDMENLDENAEKELEFDLQPNKKPVILH